MFLYPPSSPNLLNTYIKPASKEEQENVAFVVRNVIEAKNEDSLKCERT